MKNWIREHKAKLIVAGFGILVVGLFGYKIHSNIKRSEVLMEVFGQEAFSESFKVPELPAEKVEILLKHL